MMRKAVRLAGLIWLALMAIAGAFLWAAETMAWVGPVSSNRGLIYVVFAAALPGVLLYRWGRGPYTPAIRTKDLIDKIYPVSKKVRILKDDPLLPQITDGPL